MKTYEDWTLYLTHDRLKRNSMRKDIEAKLKEMPELLSIGQVADIFSIHQDTLRNWEKEGILVPLRVGKRGDRKYRPQDIQAIVDKMGSKLTLPQLEAFLWKSADILRGKIDSSDYKKYIFGLLFYKRMSDVWDEEYEAVMKEYGDATIACADYNHRFQVPKDCRWSIVTEQAENIGQKLNDIFEKLANANSPKLDRIFDDLDFANKDRFTNETLQRLVNHFSQYNFGNTYISSDLLGDAYEYLIQQFAADAGKKGGEFYTPREVERVIMGILKPHQKDHIYDPTVGSGGFLLEAYSYLKQKSGEKIAKTLYLYGQEQMLDTFAIAKINMFLHGLDSADIRRGDTLANPQFLNQQGNLQTFDIVVANPPYSIKDWESEVFRVNKHGRLDGYDMPPEKNADYAFVLHIIKSMNVNGRAGIVLPHGVLFRAGAEGRIREQILKNDLIEAVIGLPPKLFYGTGIPAVIVILNKNKPANRKGKLLIVDAQRDYLEGQNQNYLRPQDINRIVKTVDDYSNIEKYARVVSSEEISQKESTLNIREYIDSGEKEKTVSTETVWQELKNIEGKLERANKLTAESFKKIYAPTSSKRTSTWKVVKLGDIVSITTGRKDANAQVKDGAYPFFTCAREISRIDNYVFDTEAIIVAGNGDFNVKYYHGKFDAYQRTYVIEAKEGALTKFLYYVLQYYLPKLTAGARGSTIKYLKIGDFTEFQFALPSLSEQKRLVELFDIVNEKNTLTQLLKDKSDELRVGLMQDLLNGEKQI